MGLFSVDVAVGADGEETDGGLAYPTINNADVIRDRKRPSVFKSTMERMIKKSCIRRIFSKPLGTLVYFFPNRRDQDAKIFEVSMIPSCILYAYHVFLLDVLKQNQQRILFRPIVHHSLLARRQIATQLAQIPE